MVTGINLVLKPANSWETDEPKVYSSLWSISSSVMLEIIEISSIIVSFISDRETLISVFFWSDIGRRLSPVSFGITKAVLTVVPPMFMTETPVSAINRTVDRLALPLACLNVFAAVWYIVFIKWPLPDPGPLVIQRYIGSLFSGFWVSIYFILFLHQKRTVSYAIHRLLFNDLTDSRSKSYEISSGWIWDEIVGTVDARSEIYFEARCDSNCLLNNSPSLSLLSCISTCNWSFSWSKE